MNTCKKKIYIVILNECNKGLDFSQTSEREGT